MCSRRSLSEERNLFSRRIHLTKAFPNFRRLSFIISWEASCINVCKRTVNSALLCLIGLCSWLNSYRGKLLRKPHQIKLLLPAVIHRKNILLYFPPFFLKVVRFLISAIWSRYQSCIKTESEKNRVAFLVFFMLVSALGGIHWCECGTCGSLSPIAALKQVNEDIIYMECYREVSRGAGFCALHW